MWELITAAQLACTLVLNMVDSWAGIRAVDWAGLRVTSSVDTTVAWRVLATAGLLETHGAVEMAGQWVSCSVDDLAGERAFQSVERRVDVTVAWTVDLSGHALVGQLAYLAVGVTVAV